jgi:hypothetical protein
MPFAEVAPTAVAKPGPNPYVAPAGERVRVRSDLPPRSQDELRGHDELRGSPTTSPMPTLCEGSLRSSRQDRRVWRPPNVKPKRERLPPIR